MTSNAVTVHMISGQKIRLEKIMLYPAPILAQATNARAAAMKAVGSTGLGLGVAGSPGVALAGAVALGVLSSVMANAANKAAAESLQQAQAAFDKAKTKGRLFDVDEIKGLHVPDPSGWSAVGDTWGALVSISTFSKDEKKAFCVKHNIQYGMLMETNVIIPMAVPYAHSGEEFVHGVSQEGEVALRWAHVEAFVPNQSHSMFTENGLQIVDKQPTFLEWRESWKPTT